MLGWRTTVTTFFSEVGAEGLAQADGGRRLALAERRRGDGRHVDVVALGAVLEPVEDVEVDLGLVLAVEVEVVLAEAELSGDLDDGQSSVAWAMSMSLGTGLTIFTDMARTSLSFRRGLW